MSSILKNSLMIGYFADGVWAINAMRLFLNDNSIEVCFVVPRYQRPDTELMKLVKVHEIDIILEKNINSKAFIEKAKTYGCDLFVSMSFNQIFKKEIINLPKMKTINCHAGKLPFYRGRNPLNWALINNEKEFGITTHYVDIGIDTGDILVQETYPITDDDDYNTLLKKAHVECANVLYEAVKGLQTGTAKPVKQFDIHPVGFYCLGRGTGDEIVHWNQTSREVFNFIRAICPPGPSARTHLNGREIKLNKAEMVMDAPVYKGIPGSVVGKDKNSFLIKTRDSFLRIVDWEFEGNIQIGDRFSNKI